MVTIHHFYTSMVLRMKYIVKIFALFPELKSNFQHETRYALPAFDPKWVWQEEHTK